MYLEIEHIFTQKIKCILKTYFFKCIWKKIIISNIFGRRFVSVCRDIVKRLDKVCEHTECHTVSQSSASSEEDALCLTRYFSILK